VVLLDELFAAMENAEDAVTAVENASDSVKGKAQRALSHARRKYQVAFEQLGAKGSTSGESPPHSPARCQQRVIFFL
jgi:hypothetical protein